MRALLPFLFVAVAVQALCAQRRLTLGDTVQIEYRVGPYFSASRQETRRLDGLLTHVTVDSVVLDGTAGARAVARTDLLAVRRLAGRGYDWKEAARPMAIGGGVGVILGVAAVADDDLSGGEAVLAITTFTALGALPGFARGLDSHGRTGFTVGAAVGAAAGLAVGIASAPEPSTCTPSAPFCFDLPDLRALYVLAVTGAGVLGGGLIGGVVGSLKPGKRWEKLPLPWTSLGLRRLPGGRVGLVISLATH